MSKRVKNPMGDVFKYLAISILFMFFGILFGQLFIPEEVVYFANIISIFVLIGLIIFSIMSRKNIIPRSFSMNFVYLFTFIDGILIYPVMKMYIQDLGVELVMNTLLGTVILIGTLSFVANKKEPGYYLHWGQSLFYSLLGLLFFTVLSLFMGSKILYIGISVVGIIVFSLYILYDISLLKHEISTGNIVEKNDLSIHVLNIYLDFINIFLDLLRLIWELKD